MDCLPVFCEKTPRTPFVFLPLEGCWFITPNEFSRWHQPVHGSEVHVCPRVRWDRRVLTPNICVLEQITSYSPSPRSPVREMAVILSAADVERWSSLARKVVFSTRFHPLTPSAGREHPIWVQAHSLLWSVLCSVHLEPLEVRGALGPAGGTGERPGPHLLSKVQTLRSDLHGLSGPLSQEAEGCRMSPELHERCS